MILKKVDLPIIPRIPCVERLRNTRLGHHFNLHSSFICAGKIHFFSVTSTIDQLDVIEQYLQMKCMKGGERGKDTCKGDGGSPLVCPIPGKHEQYYQSGIVSWGIGCQQSNPGELIQISISKVSLKRTLFNAHKIWTFRSISLGSNSKIIFIFIQRCLRKCCQIPIMDWWAISI